jgi:hypothetical protein
MKMNDRRHRGAWNIGGATLIGLGIGLILLKMSALWFVAAVLVGIGAGVLLAAFFHEDNE